MAAPASKRGKKEATVPLRPLPPVLFRTADTGRRIEVGPIEGNVYLRDYRCTHYLGEGVFVTASITRDGAPLEVSYFGMTGDDNYSVLDMAEHYGFGAEKEDDPKWFNFYECLSAHIGRAFVEGHLAAGESDAEWQRPTFPLLLENRDRRSLGEGQDCFFREEPADRQPTWQAPLSSTPPAPTATTSGGAGS